MVIPFTREFQQERLPGIPESIDILDWEKQEVNAAAASFMDEIFAAGDDVNRLLQIASWSQQFMELWAAINLSALDKATKANGGRRES